MPKKHFYGIVPEEDIQSNLELTPEEIKTINEEEINKYAENLTIEKIHNIFFNIVKLIVRTAIISLKIYGIYLLWVCLHYFSAHLYVKFCVPNTFSGFVMSPFMIATPHCQGLRWIVYNAASVINNMWILMGTWIYSLIWSFKDGN